MHILHETFLDSDLSARQTADLQCWCLPFLDSGYGVLGRLRTWSTFDRSTFDL